MRCSSVTLSHVARSCRVLKVWNLHHFRTAVNHLLPHLSIFWINFADTVKDNNLHSLYFHVFELANFWLQDQFSNHWTTALLCADEYILCASMLAQLSRRKGVRKREPLGSLSVCCMSFQTRKSIHVCVPLRHMQPDHLFGKKLSSGIEHFCANCSPIHSLSSHGFNTSW